MVALALWGWFLSLLLMSICLREYSTSLTRNKSNKCDKNHKNGQYLVNDIDDIKFKQFQTWYIIIFILSRLSDWMLGPYVYKLYDSYNYSDFNKAILFIFGYLTSAIFGIFIGSIADVFGRKLICILFCILFSLSSIIMIHFGSNFYNLLFGRFLSGISTSILHSVFEAWMITNHHLNKYPKYKLNQTFEISMSLNSIIAIFSGIIGSYSISIYHEYDIFQSLPSCAAPLHFSCLILIITFILIVIKWKENYGFNGDDNNTMNKEYGLIESMKNSLYIIIRDKRIMSIGIIQSGFESSLYIFVFMWTSALDSVYLNHQTHNKFDHGIVFGIFMLSCFIGTCIVSIIRFKFHNTFNWIQCILMSIICIICAISLFVVVFINNFHFRLLMFVIYEICVGIYRPTLSSLRSEYISHQYMATIINIFRVPLNIIVVVVLINIEYLGNLVFIIASFLLLLCCLCAKNLTSIIIKNK